MFSRKVTPMHSARKDSVCQESSGCRGPLEISDKEVGVGGGDPYITMLVDKARHELRLAGLEMPVASARQPELGTYRPPGFEGIE